MTLRQLLEQGLKDEVFTAAEALVAHGSRIKAHERVGGLRVHSKFDLSSLTKPLVVSNLMMRLQVEKRVSLDAPVGDFFKTRALKNVSLRELLEHRSGLIAWYPFQKAQVKADKPKFEQNQKKILQAILADKALLQPQGAKSTVYSDLNFILLGAILEKISGKRLDTLFVRKVTRPLRVLNDLQYRPLPLRHAAVRQYVPSEICRERGRLIQGEVQDENAYVMGGVAGHAGLFGTAKAVYQTLWDISRNTALCKSIQQAAQQSVPDKARFVLGFDTVSAKNSHFGAGFNRKTTLCHLGFSGTSFAWDFKRDHFVVLLTNRCFFGRDNLKIKAFRQTFHDLVNKGF